MWGYVKSFVYADKPQTLDHLEDNIRRVIADIRPQMLEKVIENWTSRLDYIRTSRGSHMPEIIFKIRFAHGSPHFSPTPLVLGENRLASLNSNSDAVSTSPSGGPCHIDTDGLSLSQQADILFHLNRSRRACPSGTSMTSFSHLCFHTWQDSQEPFFNKTMLGHANVSGPKPQLSSTPLKKRKEEFLAIVARRRDEARLAPH
ncbi:hypothetical protein TNCV_4542161 [Trichonephila clavipes]|nr:hypothetical protein TNCV_4542161 [Trichonephila clavipes]